MGAIVRVICGLLIGATVTGCAAAAALTYAVTPPPTEPAKYKLEKTPVVVLVENYRNPAEFEVPAQRLEGDISRMLTENKAGRIVEAQKVMNVTSDKTADGRKLDIAAIGRRVGAKQVIYVNLVQFSVDLPIGGQTITGRAEAMVKVVEVDSGKTLWPRDTSDGRQVRTETTYAPGADSSNPAAVQEQLYQKLGDQITKLFYDAQVDTIDNADPKGYEQKL